MDARMFIKIPDDMDIEVMYEVLFTFENNATGKKYIVYTDDSVDEEGELRILASIYDPDNVNMTIYPLETEEEMEMIKAVYNEIKTMYSE